MNRLFSTAAVALALTFQGSAAAAQSAPDAPMVSVPPIEHVAANPMPAARDEFEKLAARGDFSELGKRLGAAKSIDELNRNMDWEELQILKGGSVFFNFAYMGSMWTLSDRFPEPTASRAKQFVAILALYTMEQIAIDGPRCADPSAPGHRMDLLASRPEIRRYMMSLPEGTRRGLAAEALKLEARTAKLRRDDVTLCSGGLSEINARLARDPALANRQLTPGGGGAVVLPPGPPIPPKFVDAKTTAPKQAAIRAQMPGTLAELLKLPEAQAPESAGHPPHPASPAS